VLLYSVLAVVELYLMVRAIRQGPEPLPPPAAAVRAVAAE